METFNPSLRVAMSHNVVRSFVVPRVPSVVFSPGTRGRWERGCLSRGFFPSREEPLKRFKKYLIFLSTQSVYRERT